MSTQLNRKDANLHWEKYLPAAAASNQSPSIDLGQVAGAGEGTRFELLVSVPALPNHTDSTKVVTLTVQESSDDAVGDAYANQNPLIQCRIPGVTSTGSTAQTFRIRLPSTSERYIQITQTVPSGDGDCTAGLVEYDILT